jgi:hypothetical protein
MNASSGGYQRFQTGSPVYPWWSNCYRDGAPLEHALWKNANEEPDLRVWDPAYESLGLPAPIKVPSATLALDAARPERMGSETEATPGAYQYETLVTVWDWNDPAYCRAMAMAIGFTRADLQP